jgi:hypothetical protein
VGRGFHVDSLPRLMLLALLVLLLVLLLVALLRFRLCQLFGEDCYRTFTWRFTHVYTDGPAPCVPLGCGVLWRFLISVVVVAEALVHSRCVAATLLLLLSPMPPMLLPSPALLLLLPPRAPVAEVGLL